MINHNHPSYQGHPMIVNGQGRTSGYIGMSQGLPPGYEYKRSRSKGDAQKGKASVPQTMTSSIRSQNSSKLVTAQGVQFQNQGLGMKNPNTMTNPKLQYGVQQNLKQMPSQKRGQSNVMYQNNGQGN